MNIFVFALLWVDMIVTMVLIRIVFVFVRLGASSASTSNALDENFF